MWIEDDQWPWPHHPMRLVSSVTLRRGEAAPEPRLEPDPTTTVDVFQVRPLTVDACATWCGGHTDIVDGGPAVMLPDGGVARLGDYIVNDGGYLAEPAAGFAQRYTPAQPTD